MQCPACKHPLIVLEIQETEIDYCQSCHGVWLDRGELELLLDGSQRAEELLNSLSVVRTEERSIRCPMCSRKMNKVEYGVEEKILLDRCPRNDGIWFDEGELQDALRMSSPRGDGRVYNLLNEVFGERNS